MEKKEKRLCIFLHHFTGEYCPLYVQYYLNELTHYFDEIRMVTTSPIEHTPNLLRSSIHIQVEKNEAYDFGLFYKGFQAINPSEYSQIACINDSNILFDRLDFLFDWSENVKVDFWGLVDSNEKPWFSEHEDNYHIQSHFMAFNSKAIPALQKYLSKVDFHELKKEKDLKKLRRKIINDWEIGLSQFLISEGLKSATYYDSKQFLKKHGQKGKNVTHVLYKELIMAGYPLLKKRIALSKSWKSLFTKKAPWEKLIIRYGNPEWNLPELIESVGSKDA